MTQKIGLISDVHATPEPLKEALSIFREQGVDQFFCAGDIAGYGDGLAQTIDLMAQSRCRSILGNHDVWYLDRPKKETDTDVVDFFNSLPYVIRLTIASKKLYFVHASPTQSLKKGIHLLDEAGLIRQDQKKIWDDRLEDFDYDVLIVGHTHQVFAEKLGNTLVVNPGSTVFNHTCAILSLPEMTCQIMPLSGKKPVKVWNWGIFRASE
jgi:putative phosphoesterase